MKTLLITGGAAGIGLATATHFAKQGYFVGIYDINSEALEVLKNSGEFPQACFGICDVRNPESIEAMFADFAHHTDGRLDILVNNAGVLSSGEFADLDSGAHDTMIDINVRGLTQVAQQGFALLRDTPNSCMVNLCSASSIHGIPKLAVYSASKFYVNGLTQALSLEWRKHGIRVTSVKPPFVRTAMVDKISPSLMHFLKVDTEPHDVALAIERAVNGSRDGYILGASVRLWARLDRFMPEPIARSLTRTLTKS